MNVPTQPPAGDSDSERDILADWNAIHALIRDIVGSLLALPALKDPRTGAYMGLNGERALVELAHEFGKDLCAAIAAGFTRGRSDEDTIKRLERERDGLHRRIAALSDEIGGYERQVRTLTRERDALAKFKAYVHQRLDDAGVPVDPPSEHREKGCRIGGRLDWLLAHVAAHEANQRDVRVEIVRLARADLAAAEQRAAKLANINERACAAGLKLVDALRVIAKSNNVPDCIRAARAALAGNGTNTAGEGDGWIACSERMPATDPTQDCVIVAIDMGDNEPPMSWCAFWNGNAWRDQGATCFDGVDADVAGRVYAWRPLPAPPTAGEKQS